MSNIDKAERTLKAAITRNFPDLGLVATGTPEDAVLIDLLIRVNPDVKIFWLGDEEGLEEIKSKYYVTPLRNLRAWRLKAVLRSDRLGPVLEDDGGLELVRPLAGWSVAQVRAYLREKAVPAGVRS